MESTLTTNLNVANTNINHLSNYKADKYYSGAVASSFIIPDNVSEIIITVAVNGNPEILLQSHWTNQMVNWWDTSVKAFRMIGKSGINGVEYGAVIAYDTTNKVLALNSAWQGTTDVTQSTTVTWAYR